MACVDEGEPPPIQLRMAWQCERWNCLPERGGLNDQDAHMMATMTGLSNIYNALTKYRNSVGAQIHQLTDNERRVLRMLLDLGLFNG